MVFELVYELIGLFDRTKGFVGFARKN